MSLIDAPHPGPIDDNPERVSIVAAEKVQDCAADRFGSSTLFNVGNKPSYAATHNIRGFTDLPGELRNTIYRLIYQKFEVYVYNDQQGKKCIDTIRVRPSIRHDSQTLAIIDVNHQIRQEFLTLLIFPRLKAIVQGPAHCGPLSLAHPDYATSFTIRADVMLDFMFCRSDEHLSGRPSTLNDKDICEHCFSEQRVPRELIATYKSVERTASFCFELETSYDLTSESRRLIASTLHKIFKVDDDLNIENFFLVTHRLSSLRLEVIWNRGQLYPHLSTRYDILFEVFVADEKSPLEIRGTRQRRHQGLRKTTRLSPHVYYDEV